MSNFYVIQEVSHVIFRKSRMLLRFAEAPLNYQGPPWHRRSGTGRMPLHRAAGFWVTASAASRACDPVTWEPGRPLANFFLKLCLVKTYLASLDTAGNLSRLVFQF